MNAQDLQALIDSLTQDIEFEYAGKPGAICPYSRQDIAVTFDGVHKRYTSSAALMRDPIYLGAALMDIASKIQLD
ncbi:MAG: hypothetical protein VB087_07910 [Candidatus Limiplasma sp.]|nr:hypothetical protein [Candidatus Limiplasma sp.]